MTIRSCLSCRQLETVGERAWKQILSLSPSLISVSVPSSGTILKQVARSIRPYWVLGFFPNCHRKWLTRRSVLTGSIDHFKRRLWGKVQSAQCLKKERGRLVRGGAGVVKNRPAHAELTFPISSWSAGRPPLSGESRRQGKPLCPPTCRWVLQVLEDGLSSRQRLAQSEHRCDDTHLGLSVLIRGKFRAFVLRI